MNLFPLQDIITMLARISIALAIVSPLLPPTPPALAQTNPAAASTTVQGQQPAPKNPLAALPSEPGPHLKLIAALGDNEWVNLGQAAPDPKYGVARGRAWCPKLAFAPDLGGAFFCGTGAHGAMPDGRYMDDLWFYDAQAHRWICLYPGADPKTLKLKLDKYGFEVNQQGESIPVSYLSHAYCNTTYNTDLRLYHIAWIQCPWWTKALPKRWSWLDQSYPAVQAKNYGNVGSIISSPKHPLFWNVGKAKWERKFVEGPGPDKLFQGIVEYIPSLKKTLYIHYGTVWYYDYAAGVWTASGKVPASVSGYDANGCYDPKRQRIYVARGPSFAWYDIEADTWHESSIKGQPENLFGANNAQMYYDSASGVVLWHKSKGDLYIFNPSEESWTNLGNTAPEIPWKRFSPNYMGTHGYYDANLNVHFFYRAGDSNHTDATMLAYRYRRQPVNRQRGTEGK